MGYNLLINGVFWGYNPITNHLLTSWDIQATLFFLSQKSHSRLQDTEKGACFIQARRSQTFPSFKVPSAQPQEIQVASAEDFP